MPVQGQNTRQKMGSFQPLVDHFSGSRIGHDYKHGGKHQDQVCRREHTAVRRITEEDDGKVMPAYGNETEMESVLAIGVI